MESSVKGKRKSFKTDQCAIARSLDAIGDWWSLLIVRDALAGRRRFGEFHKSLGVARNILTTRLRKLVAHGIMEIVPAADGSAYQEYVLTEQGKRLQIVLMAIWQWGETALFAPGEMRIVLCDRQNGEPLPRIELRARDGRVLRPGDTMLQRAKPRSGARRRRVSG
jgi:DNA-binding HxlR family transcriptional regulator